MFRFERFLLRVVEPVVLVTPLSLSYHLTNHYFSFKLFTQPKMCSIHNDDDSQVDGNESSQMKKCRKLEIENEKLKGDVNNLSRHCRSLKAIHKLLLKIKGTFGEDKKPLLLLLPTKSTGSFKFQMSSKQMRMGSMLRPYLQMKG